MTNSQRLALVRAHLQKWVADSKTDQNHSSDVDAQAIICESIVIRDGFFCGRSFQMAEYRAVWFIEEDELKIYDTEGVVATFQGDEIGVDTDATEEPSVIKLDSRESKSDGEDDLRRAA